MKSGLMWEEMTVVDVSAIDDRTRQDAERAFARAGCLITANEMEWRQSDEAYAAKSGELFCGFLKVPE